MSRKAQNKRAFPPVVTVTPQPYNLTAPGGRRTPGSLIPLGPAPREAQDFASQTLRMPNADGFIKNDSLFAIITAILLI
ncbi:MAG: hypothetical protein K5751_06290 [Treponemataceae bacterium]|nr:hypothetical protein [Treponemataceae bacterium]